MLDWGRIRRVWNRLALCVILTACGFRSSATGGDGAGGGGSDAAIDGTGGGSGDGSSAATDCWSHWMGGSLAIDASTVQEIMELSSAGDDRNPWISDDGLRMYFSRDLLTNTGDIYFTSRTSPTGTFDPPVPVANLNTTGREGRVTLTPDELALAISTERGSTLGHPQIDMETRNPGDMFASPNTTYLNAVNAVGTQRFDPFLTSDLLRLYFAADTGTGGTFQLLVAARASATVDFGTPALIPGTQDDTVNKADPTLYQGEQLLVFSSLPPGPGANADLYYATRSSTADDFGTPIQIPTVDTDVNEIDPMLSHDGCELYFASDRDITGNLHLFRAQITR